MKDEKTNSLVLQERPFSQGHAVTVEKRPAF
jgi:hypothetical protein